MIKFSLERSHDVNHIGTVNHIEAVVTDSHGSRRVLRRESVQIYQFADSRNANQDTKIKSAESECQRVIAAEKHRLQRELGLRDGCLDLFFAATDRLAKLEDAQSARHDRFRAEEIEEMKSLVASYSTGAKS